MGDCGKDSALFAECKWTNSRVDTGVLETLLERGDLFPHINKHFFLFAKSGFTKGCADMADELGNVSLVSYEEMVQ